jgi:hypothetical protein
MPPHKRVAFFTYSLSSAAITFILSSAAVAASSINGWHFLLILFYQPLLPLFFHQPLSRLLP